MPAVSELIAASAEREAAKAPPLQPGSEQWERLRALLHPAVTTQRKTA